MCNPSYDPSSYHPAHPFASRTLTRANHGNEENLKSESGVTQNPDKQTNNNNK